MSMKKVFSLLIAVCFLPGCSWSRIDVDKTKDVGDKIVIALKKYKSEHDVYPTALRDLVPKYLKKIPRPVVSRVNWEYFTDTALNEFTLRLCDNYKGQSLYYHSEKAKWRFDDGSI